jgi:riboflavin kinase/FMN adenylyltransferase
MNVVTWDGLSAVPSALQQHVVTIGNFDGVHRGHRALIRRLLRLKERLNKPALVVTFDPPPVVVLRPHLPLEPLATLSQRLEALSQLGVDRLLVLQSSTALFDLSAETFWQCLLREQLQVQGIVEGRNFCFGKDRLGTIRELTAWCRDAQLPCEVVDDVYRRRMRISSSSIREAIRKGDVQAARLGLGQPYAITGTVVKGDQRGRTIGFPTCNLAEIATLIPASGVYVAEAIVGNAVHAAMVNIGPNPTFGIDARKVEAHLLNFAGDLYHSQLTLRFLARLRDTTRFGSIVELQEQLARDREQTEQVYHDNRRKQLARPRR